MTRFWIVLLIVVLALAGTVVWLNQTKEVTSDNIGLLSSITIPDGWYAHATGDPENIILTKARELPNIGATETYAYGEQINVGRSEIDTPAEEWAESTALSDDVMIRDYQWQNGSNYKLLKVESDAGGASGGVLTYYLFTENILVTFYLYPLEEGPEETPTRNNTGIEALEVVLYGYMDQII